MYSHLSHDEVRNLFFQKIEENIAYIIFKYEDIAFAHSKGSFKDLSHPSIYPFISSFIHNLRPVLSYVEVYEAGTDDYLSGLFFEITHKHILKNLPVSQQEKDLATLKELYENSLTEDEKVIFNHMLLQKAAESLDWKINGIGEEFDTQEQLTIAEQELKNLWRDVSFSLKGVKQGEIQKKFPMWFIKGLYKNIEQSKRLAK